MDQALTIGMVFWTFVAVAGFAAAAVIFLAILAFIASGFNR